MKLHRFYGALALVCLLLCCARGVLAASDDQFDYYFRSGSDVTQGVIIHGYHGAETDLFIPKTIRGGPVVEIRGFESNETLRSVILPDTVTSIQYSAFRNCVNLETVTLSRSLQTIDWNAFSGCTALKQITLPDGLQKIGNMAFQGCTALQSVNIPASVQEIDYYAFQNCSELTSVTFAPKAANGLAIKMYAFDACNLSEVKLPANTTIIEYGCFRGNSNLTVLDLPDELESVDSQGDITLIVGEGSKTLTSLLRNAPHGYILRGSYVPKVTEGNSADARAKAIVKAVIKPGMTDYEKALVLHDYLIYHANYDHSLTYHSADGVLLKGKGVCQSYALAYQKLLNLVGIKNTTERGYNHIWNMILLDGEWYHVDCTWDDPGDGGSENHTYFCVSNYGLRGVSNHECYNKPHTSKAYKYNFAYKNGGLDPRIDELKALIAENGKEKAVGESFEVAAETFNYGWDQGIFDRTAIMVVQDQGVIGSGYAYTVNVDYDPSAIEWYDDDEEEEDEDDGTYDAAPPDPSFIPRSTTKMKLKVTITSKSAVKDMGSVSLAVGDSCHLPLPADAGNATWSLSGNAFAVQDGWITALSAGETTASALVKDASGAQTRYVFTVTAEQLSTLTLPAGLVRIGQDAFKGNPAEHIVVGANVAHIEANAFAGMTRLKEVCFLSPDTVIDPNAFSQTSDLRFICAPDSQAAAFAEEHRIPHAPVWNDAP